MDMTLNSPQWLIYQTKHICFLWATTISEKGDICSMVNCRSSLQLCLSLS